MKQTHVNFRSLILLLAAVILTSAQHAMAGAHEIQRESLRNLRPIAFEVSPLPEWAEKDGTTRRALDDLAREKFAEARVPMASDSKKPMAKLVAVISGNVFLNSKGAPVAYMFTLGFSLYQPAALFSTREAMSVSTWGSETAGLYQFNTDAAVGVRTAFQKMLDGFIQDYNAANSPSESK